MSEGDHKYKFGQHPEMPWKKDKEAKERITNKVKRAVYSKRLSLSFNDDKNIAQEFLLIWIGAMLTGIFIFVILGYVGQ